MGRIVPYIMETQKCLKPPTSQFLGQHFSPLRAAPGHVGGERDHRRQGDPRTLEGTWRATPREDRRMSLVPTWVKPGWVSQKSEPWCWYIKTYITGWFWTRANVGKYGKYCIHGAYGYWTVMDCTRVVWLQFGYNWLINICCTGLVQGGATEIVNAKLVNISFLDQWIMDLGLLSKTS